MGVKGAQDCVPSFQKKKYTGIDPLLRVLSSTLARTPILPTHRFRVLENSIFLPVFVDRLNKARCICILFFQ